MPHEVLAELVRSSFVEGHHHGSVVALHGDGSVDWALGDPEAWMLPRSANKPLQALAMVRAGLDVPDDLLALACGSHSGEDVHVEGVRRLLASAGLEVTALRCPEDLPLEPRVRDAFLRAGGQPARVRMNCSGKHAAMLATCVASGWSVDGYLDREHPLQQAVVATFEDLVGHPVPHVAVDGCGAPLLATSLVGLARAFRRLALGADAEGRPDADAARVAGAMRRHPAMVSGTARDERRLHDGVPGLITKMGAEAVQAVGLPDGRALALKIDDGAERARPVVLAAALRRMGLARHAEVEPGLLDLLGAHPLQGGGVVVGELRATI